MNIQTWMEKAWSRNQLGVTGHSVLCKNSRTKGSQEIRGTGEGRRQKKTEDKPTLHAHSMKRYQDVLGGKTKEQATAQTILHECA